PVSEADRAAEEAIRSLVARERSGEGVFGEELGDDGGRCAAPPLPLEPTCDSRARPARTISRGKPGIQGLCRQRRPRP
ncbi:MAG TPA: hypothetical protein VGM80_06775, partial [Gaiellaceae bacterium]